jgi:hypothetical protein
MTVTLSATDNIGPTFKQLIPQVEAFLNSLKMGESGITAFEAKARTASVTIKGAFGESLAGTTGTRGLTAFSAGLRQTGIDFTNTGTQAVAATSKFQQFGSALLQNGTAFGVAGASAFGLFNAIDNLEKVQLRASTSTLRASTATTALTQAENALATAKASGTATTEQIAILELRVSDARERVSVTTERAAIFQQDYTEALAGLALQVGPQAIALGGSLAQVYTVLNTTFAKGGGAINILKTAFASLMGTEAATTAGTLATSGAIRTIGTAAPIAATGVRTLSTAMKGLLIGTGVGAILAIGSAIAEMALTMQDANAATSEFAANSAESLGEAGGSVKDFETSWQTSMKNVETQASNSGSHIAMIMQKIADDTKQSLDTVKRETLQNMVDSKNLLLKSAQQQLAGIPQNMNLLDAFLSGKGLPEEQKAKLTKVIDEIKADLKTLEPQLQSTTDQFNAMWLGSNTGANLLLGTLSLVDKQMLMQSGSTGVVIDDMKNLSTSAKDTASNISGPWVAAWHKGTISMDVAKLAVTNIIKEFFGLSKIPMDLLLGEVNNLFKDGAKNSIAYADAVTKATAAQSISTEEAAKQAVAMQANIVHNDLMVRSLAGRSAAMTTTIAQDQAFNDIIVAGIAGLNEQAAAILTTRDANVAGNDAVKQAIINAGQEVIALTNLGAIYDGSATSLLALTKAKVAGATAAKDFVAQTALERTTMDQTTASLLQFITATEGINIKPNISVTLGLLKDIQKEMDATGNAAMTLAAANKEQLAPSFEVLADALAKTNTKEFNKAFKDIEFGDIPNKLEKALQQGGQKMQKFAEKAREIFSLSGALVEEAMAGVINNKTFDAGIDSITQRLSKLNKGQAEGIQPIIAALKGLTELPMGEAASQLAKLNPVIELIAKNSKDGKNSVTDINEELALFEKITKDTSGPDAMATSVGGMASSMELLKTRIPTPGDLASIDRLRQQFLHPEKPPGPDESFKLDEKDGKDGEGGTVVPAPTKAAGFDQAKQAIIDEVKTMFTKDPPPPAIIPAPNADAFTNAMNTLLLIPADFTTRFNAAFVGLIIPAPDQSVFANAMNTIALIPADIKLKFNTAFASLIIPAPITAPFVTGIGVISTTVAAVIKDISVLQTAVAIPAPDTTAFDDAFTQSAADAVTELDSIRAFVADDLTTGFSQFDDFVSGDVTDMFSQFATDSNDSLQEIVDFLNDDLTTAFEDLQSTAESVAEGVAGAMDDIGAAAASAEGEVQSLIDAINNIPTRVDITIFVGLEGPGVAFLAGGYHGIVDKPTLLVVGEAGAERVDVSPATGPASDNLFIQGNDSRTGITNPLLQKDSGPIGMPLPYTQPPVVSGPVGPMVANITIPVYINGQYQGTQQTTKILRDMGAFLG